METGGLSPACHVVFRSCQSEAAGRRGEDVEGESGVGGSLTLVLQKFPMSRLPTGPASGRAEAGRVGGQRRSGKKDWPTGTRSGLLHRVRRL